MPRSLIAPVLSALLLAAPLPAQEATTQEPATGAETPAAAPVVLLDMQVTILNQSGQMLMRFEAVPDLGVADSGDDSIDPDAGAAPDGDGAAAPATDDPRSAAGGELLKGGVVSAGNYGILTVPGGATVCTFTLISTLADGQTVEAKTDICANPIYTLLPPG